ncbi:MAG: DUF5348 domain-containing protein [Bdellovibrionaceae bacterium]|nr:DUF5348 domain-containing protein [Pseudobdellovibrionaceae bacterium]
MNESNEGKLRRNDIGRWEFLDIELTSGSLVEICIEGHWICGAIEHWQDGYYWFSRRDGVTVILHSGIKARLPNSHEGRSVNP